MRKVALISIIFLAGLILASCGGGGSGSEGDLAPPKSMVAATASDDPMENKGIGPIKTLKLPTVVDQVMATAGAEVYKTYCTACHKPTEKFIGPAPKGVLDRRSPEWVMNMILNPEQMVKEDPIARKLLVEYNISTMANQGLD